MKDRNVDLHLIDWDCVVLDEYHFGAWQGAAKEVCDPAPLATAKDPGKAEERAEEKAAESDAERADEIADLADAGTPRLIAATPDSGITADLDTADLRLSGRHFLYLSGTPFRALTEGEFNEDAIYNWTYPDEQYAKQQWAADQARDPERNPYRELPQMQMFTYALSEVASVAIDQGADGLFDLSGFFEAKKIGSEYHFTDPNRVNEFLNMLRGRLTQSATEKLLNNFKPPFPYSDARFAAAVDHTVWFLSTVASAHAMKAALEAHPFFRDFLVHVAAGSGAKMGAEAKDPVDAMLARAAKTGKQTITLSCGKLMTGVTVPQWGAILILRSLKSPESYFQAAFRVQSPWTTRNDDGTRTINKQTCYVFDFDPNRALSLVYQYGIKLAGGSTSTAPSDVIGELIEFLPIFAFDGGRMDPVDVNAVMDWGTAGAGAAMLAKRWGSPRLIDLSEDVLRKLLADTDLVGRLEQMEDFRSLRQDASKIIAQSQQAPGGQEAQRRRGRRARGPRREGCPQGQARAGHEPARQAAQVRPSRSGIHVPDRLPRGGTHRRHRVAGHAAVRACHRPDARGLPQARRCGCIPPCTHERGHLAVPSVRAHQPRLPRSRAPRSRVSPRGPVGSHRHRTRARRALTASFQPGHGHAATTGARHLSTVRSVLAWWRGAVRPRSRGDMDGASVRFVRKRSSSNKPGAYELGQAGFLSRHSKPT